MVGVGAGVCVSEGEEGGEHDPGKTLECRGRSREETRGQKQTRRQGALETRGGVRGILRRERHGSYNEGKQGAAIGSRK